MQSSMFNAIAFSAICSVGCAATFERTEGLYAPAPGSEEGAPFDRDAISDRLEKWDLSEGKISEETGQPVCSVQLTMMGSRYVGTGLESPVCKGLKDFRLRQETAESAFSAARRRFLETMHSLVANNSAQTDGKEKCDFREQVNGVVIFDYHLTDSTLCTLGIQAYTQNQVAEQQFVASAVRARQDLRALLKTVQPQPSDFDTFIGR